MIHPEEDWESKWHGMSYESWSDHSLNRVCHELAKEYPWVTSDVIERSIGLAMTMVNAEEGSVKLLAVARKEVGLLLALSPCRRHDHVAETADMQHGESSYAMS
jgi:hypothetical protein